MATQASRSGIGLTGSVFLVFLTLKLIDKWSWLWVTAPLWMPVAVILGIVGVFCTIGAIAIVISHGVRRLRRPRKDRKP